MDVIQQLAEQLKEQCVQDDQPENNEAFRSVFSINGNPIMPPLMTPERRLEMQKFREAAKQIEGKLCSTSRYSRQTTPSHSKYSTLRMGDGCGGQLVDASTNTDALSAAELVSEVPTQPLIVMGRFKQTLEMTEPLIFDNKCNAIMKFVRHTREKQPKTPQLQLLLEQCMDMNKQTAVIKEQAATFALSTAQTQTDIEAEVEVETEAETELETEAEVEAELDAEAEAEAAAELKLAMQEEFDTEIIEKIVKATATEATNSKASKLVKPADNKHTQRELRRFPTMPLISTKTESYALPRQERLHPTLWKRYHSYPYSDSCQPSDCAAPISPCGDASQPLNLPTQSPPSDAMSKIQIKQRMAPEELQQTPVGGKLSGKTAGGSQQKLGSLKSCRKTLRAASSTVKYAAHASSHANAEGGMSSTQRRLSYDPRATLKRAATLKRTTTSQQQQQPAQAASAAAAAGGSNATLLKQKLLDEMEQQQRQRFHQLVSQQAEEQQRMQQEFQSQQQLLMDQMISDMSTYTYDKLEQPEPSLDSDSSSITSLPQSRLELEVDITVDLGDDGLDK